MLFALDTAEIHSSTTKSSAASETNLSLQNLPKKSKFGKKKRKEELDWKVIKLLSCTDESKLNRYNNQETGI